MTEREREHENKTVCYVRREASTEDENGWPNACWHMQRRGSETSEWGRLNALEHERWTEPAKEQYTVPLSNNSPTPLILSFFPWLLSRLCIAEHPLATQCHTRTHAHCLSRAHLLSAVGRDEVVRRTRTCTINRIALLVAHNGHTSMNTKYHDRMTWN